MKNRIAFVLVAMFALFQAHPCSAIRYDVTAIDFGNGYYEFPVASGFRLLTRQWTDEFAFTTPSLDNPLLGVSIMNIGRDSASNIDFISATLRSSGLADIDLNVSNYQLATFPLSLVSSDRDIPVLANRDYLLSITYHAGSRDASFHGSISLRSGAADPGPLPEPSSPGAVPEPSTWAIMVLGTGFIGTAMRMRRSRRTAKRSPQRSERPTGRVAGSSPLSDRQAEFQGSPLRFSAP